MDPGPDSGPCLSTHRRGSIIAAFALQRDVLKLRAKNILPQPLSCIGGYVPLGILHGSRAEKVEKIRCDPSTCHPGHPIGPGLLVGPRARASGSDVRLVM